MNRRSFLGLLGAVATATTAGCATGPGAETTTPPAETPTATPTATPTSTAPAGTATPTSSRATTTSGSRVVDVSAGPEGRLRFRPESVEIRVDDTVRWTFDSPGHNVTTLPGASEKVSIPDEAEPFASYEGDRHFSINDVDSTYEHTFTVPGEYVYVCAPHADQGMVGTVVVSE